MEITIVGAGIGGLTTALILKQKGFEVKLYEAAAEIKPVGAGIIIANNAMQVFQKHGIHQKIAGSGNRISQMTITDSHLRCLSSVDLSGYEKKYGVHNVAIHRGVLQKLLADEIGFECIHLSKRLSKIERSPSSIQLTFEDQSTLESQFVIGADGIKSTIRNQLFKTGILRDAGQKCWRGVCEMELPANYHHQLIEAWGKGKRFGFVKINNKQVYWYALTNADELRNENNLIEWFEDFHPLVLEIISSTTPEQIVPSKIFDLEPLYCWQEKNVCLLGDAAHATTPNMGQGACQAVEDAYVLGKLLKDKIAIEEALTQYEALRRKKAHAVVNMSWKIGKLAHLENNLGILLRNILMKSLPRYINRKQMEWVFTID